MSILLLIIVIGLIYVLNRKAVVKRNTEKEDVLKELEIEYETEKDSLKLSFEQSKKGLENEIIKLNKEKIELDVEFKRIKIEFENLAQKEVKKREEVKLIESMYINPKNLHKYLELMNEFSVTNINSKLEINTQEFLNLFFIDKFIPMKISLRSKKIIKALKNPIFKYRRDFDLLSKLIQFDDILLLKNLNGQAVYKCFRDFVQEQKINPEVKSIILTHAKRNINQTFDAIEEINSVCNKLKNKRVVNVEVATRDELKIIKNIIQKNKEIKAIFKIKINNSLIGGFNANDDFYYLDFSTKGGIEKIEKQILEEGDIFENRRKS